jgi:hypothetical protein
VTDPPTAGALVTGGTGSLTTGVSIGTPQTLLGTTQSTTSSVTSTSNAATTNTVDLALSSFVNDNVVAGGQIITLNYLPTKKSISGSSLHS